MRRLAEDERVDGEPQRDERRVIPAPRPRGHKDQRCARPAGPRTPRMAVPGEYRAPHARSGRGFGHDLQLALTTPRNRFPGVGLNAVAGFPPGGVIRSLPAAAVATRAIYGLRIGGGGQRQLTLLSAIGDGRKNSRWMR